MSVRKDTITAQFRAGVNVGDDPKTVNQELLKCENGYFDRMGAISKRTGYAAIGSVTADILTKYKEKPVTISGSSVKIFDGTSFDTVDSLFFSNFDVDVKRSESGNVFLCPTVEKIGDVLYIGYSNLKLDASGNPKYYPTLATYDETTGLLIDVQEMENGEDSDPRYLRIASDGTDVYAFYIDSSDRISYHSASNLGAIDNSSTVVTTGVVRTTSFNCFDCMALGDGSGSILFAFVDTSNDVRVTSMQSGSAVATDTITCTAANSIGLWKFASDQGMLLYCDGGTVRSVGYDGDCSVTSTDVAVTTGLANPPINMTGVPVTAGTARVFLTLRGTATGETKVVKSTYTDSGPSYGSVTDVVYRVTMASQPIVISDKAHIIVHYKSLAASGEQSAQSMYCVVNENGQPVGKYLVGNAGPVNTPTEYVYGVMSHTLESGSDWLIGALVRTSSSTNAWSGAGRTKYIFNDIGFSLVTMSDADPKIECLEQNGLLLIPNSCPWQMDGQEVVEQGYIQYPEGLSAAIAGAGALTEDSTYGYRACYEWQDAQGNTHLSAASPTLSVTLAVGEDEITVTVPTLTLTRRSNVKIVLYRTVTNGDIYYRHMVKDNDPLDETVSFNDKSADSALSGKALLYTTGNLADNIQPGQYWLHCLHQERVFYVPAENSSTRVYYSKKIFPMEGIPHTDLFYIEVPVEGGEITALASFMGQLLIFKEEMIYAASGAGYTDDMQGENYSKPFQISRDVGCISHKSICKIDKGVLFETSRGICLLDQTFRTSRTGERVRYLTDNYTISKGIVHQGMGSVIFFTDGPAIVYSYLFDQWSTFTEHEATDAVRCDGTLYWHDGTDDEIRVGSSDYLDDGSSIIMTLETGWIALAELGGAFRVDRVWPIGQNISSHILNIQTAVDLVPYWDEAQQFDADTFGLQFSADDHYTGLTDGYADKEYIVEVRMRRPKCHAIRFRIFDSEAQSGEVKTYEGYSITALAMRVAKRTGPLQVGSGRQV